MISYVCNLSKNPEITLTWSTVESVCFRNPDFGPKIIFFNGTPFFFQKTIGGHGHGLRIGVGPVTKSFFVSDLDHFSQFSLKSLTRPHYGVLSVSNKPALTVHRPFGLG